MRKIVIAVILALFVSGCAFTRSVTPLQYKYSGSPVVKFSDNASLEVKKFEDSRNVNDGTVIFQKSNAYGKTTGSYSAERPFVDIVRDAVLTGLESAGAQTNSGTANIVLEGDLKENDYDVRMGFWTGTVTCQVTLKLRLIDKTTGKLLWQDTIVGKATSESAWGGADFLLQLCKKAIDNLVEQIMADDQFRQAVQSK